MLKLENVSYTYMPGSPFEAAALKNINIEIGENEFVGLIGCTGSGKSTLIQLMCGLLRPTAGKILLNGQEFFAKDTNMRLLRQNIGLVMQYPEYQLFEETAAKDISYGPRNMGLSEEEIKERVSYAASLCGIGKELLKRSPFELSGGQKRRVAIAGVIAMMPKILILDEPAAGLDPGGRDEILYKIRDLQKRMNISVVLVSHSMEDVSAVCERLVVLSDGEKRFDASVREVFMHGEELEKMGLDIPASAKICEALRAASFPLPTGIYTADEAAEEILKLYKSRKL